MDFSRFPSGAYPVDSGREFLGTNRNSLEERPPGRESLFSGHANFESFINNSPHEDHIR